MSNYGDSFDQKYANWRCGKDYDGEVAAKVITDILMDPNEGSYGCFERLAAEYGAGNEEVRRTIDMVLENLTGYDMESILDKVTEKQMEEELEKDE